MNTCSSTSTCKVVDTSKLLMPKSTVKCAKCKKDSDVYLPYSNTNLCKKHFIESIEKKFKRTNREFNFIKKGDKVAIGLSGGKDSMVLLYLLDEFRKTYPFELIAITIDSGIESEYWNKVLKLAKDATKKLNIPHYVYSYKNEFKFTLDELVKKLNLKNPCSYCGVFRRYLLNKKTRELGATKLAIGHNLDDAAQTVLLNLVRNEPTRLLRFNEHLSESKGFVPRIKPLVRILEEEVVEFGELKGFGLESKSCCHYSSFAMRKQVRAKLDELEMLYPGTKLKIFNSFVSMQKLMKTGLQEKNFEIGECRVCKEPSSKEMCMCCKKLDEAYKGMKL